MIIKESGVIMTKGLVLEGGAMRGLFTAGVMDFLMEKDAKFDIAAGVSAGAAFGCNIKSKQIGRVLRYNLAYCDDPRYCSRQSLIRTGDLFGAEFCYHTIPDELDPFDTNTFDGNPMKFYAVCSDANTGRPVYKLLDKAGYDCYEWIRASASMPLVSRVVKIDGYELLDGGMTDSIPLKFIQNKGAQRTLVVLTQPREYVKKRNRALPLMRIALRRYPRLLEAIANRHNHYNAQRRLVFEQEKRGKIIVICPDSPLLIGKTEHNPENMKRVYNLGRAAAEKKWDEIREYFSN